MIAQRMRSGRRFAWRVEKLLLFLETDEAPGNTADAHHGKQALAACQRPGDTHRNRDVNDGAGDRRLLRVHAQRDSHSAYILGYQGGVDAASAQLLPARQVNVRAVNQPDGANKLGDGWIGIHKQSRRPQKLDSAADHADRTPNAIGACLTFVQRGVFQNRGELDGRQDDGNGSIPEAVLRRLYGIGE